MGHFIKNKSFPRAPRKFKKQIKKKLGENAYRKISFFFVRTRIYKCKKTLDIMDVKNVAYTFEKGKLYLIQIYHNQAMDQRYTLFTKQELNLLFEYDHVNTKKWKERKLQIKFR